MQPPPVADVLSPNPSLSSLRALIPALTPSISIEEARTLNVALLDAATSAVGEGASESGPSRCAAAARAHVGLVVAVPRAYDALVLDTLVRKMAKAVTDDEGGKAKAKGRKKNRKSTGVDGGEEMLAADVAAFWKELVRLAEAPVTGDGFLATLAVGFAGLLVGGGDGMRLAERGFAAVLERGEDGIKAVYNALLPVCVGGKVSAAMRSALAAVLGKAVKVDNSCVVELETDNSEKGASPMALCSKDGDDDNDDDDDDGIAKDSSGKKTVPDDARRFRSQNSLAFIQACCCRAPERADARAHLIHLLLALLPALDESCFERLVDFTTKLSRQSRSLLRVFAAELAAALVPPALDGHTGKLEVLFDMFVERAGDKIAAVRAKAISCLASATESAVSFGEGSLVVQRTAERLLLPRFDVEGRADDSKSGVRKAIVELVTVLGCSLGKEVGGSKRNYMLVRFALVAYRRCEDIVPTVRRVAMRSVTQFVGVAFSAASVQYEQDLVAYTVETRKKILQFWLDGVLPRVVDVEALAQESTLAAFQTLILDPLVSASPPTDECFIEVYLRSLCGGESATGRYTATVVGKLTSQGEISSKVVSALQTRALDRHTVSGSETENAKQSARGAWALLAEIVEADTKGKYGKYIDGERMTEAALDGSGGRHACRIAAAMATEIADQDRRRLGGKLFTALCAFINSSSSGDISLEMDAVPVMTRALAAFDSCKGNALLACLDKRLFEETEDWDELLLMSCLAITGEVCSSFELADEPPARLVNRVQALIDNSQPHRVRAMALATLGKMCICDAAPAGRRSKRNAPSSQNLCASPAYIAPIRKVGSTEGDRVSRRLTFGELLARKSIALFVRELNDGGSEASRVNSLIVLCDLCRRYTSIVEPHLGRLAMCLRDESDVVRNRALASLTSLLQEDYLKVRGGPLFFRLVLSLLDRVVKIRHSAEYVLINVLLPKAPKLMFTNLVEIIFVLNNCRAHAVYNQFLSTQEEVIANAVMASKREDRFRAYQWVMTRIIPEQRVGISARLRQEIFVPVIDGALDLGKAGVASVVIDALKILSMHEMCLLPSKGGNNGGSNDGEFDDDELPATGGTVPASQASLAGSQETTGAAAPGNKTKVLIVAKIYELELKEETLPVLIELKRHLEATRSPIAGDVSESLCGLLRPYRTDLSTIIEDSTLRAELEYDLKQQDIALKKKKEARAQAESSLFGQTLSAKNLRNTPGKVASQIIGKGSIRTPARTPGKATTPRKSSAVLRESSNLPRTPATRTPTSKVQSRRVSFGGRDSTDHSSEAPSLSRLESTLKASPRLQTITASNRKEREAVVFDMKDGDGEDEENRFTDVVRKSQKKSGKTNANANANGNGVAPSRQSQRRLQAEVDASQRRTRLSRKLEL